MSEVPAGQVEIEIETAIEAAVAAPLRGTLLRAWSLPARSFDERVDRTIRAGYQLGMRSLEAPARAVLAAPDLGGPIERAEAAVRLAPALPAAHAALAEALWRDGQWRSALRALGAACAAVPAHLEAALWARATLLDVLFSALAGGALLFLAVVVLISLPRWVGQLSAIREDLPAPSRFAMVASLLLMPAAVGEGPVGVVAALVFVAAAHGSIWRRGIVALAAAAFLVALFPVLDQASEARAVLGSDPAAVAAHAAEHGFPSAAELARIEWAGTEDPLAARALALRAKRTGDLDAAAARYAVLVEAGEGSVAPDLLNNVAGVALGRGNVEEAIEYYERAVNRAGSPLVLFNLSQAYGRAIRLDEQDLALAQAQAIDPDEVAQLTGDFGGTAMGLVADVPIPVEVAAARLWEKSDGRRLARKARGRIAPGWLGTGLGQALGGFGIALLLGSGLGIWLSRIMGEDDDHYADIARILQSRGGDPAARMARIAQIRDRHARVARFEKVLSFVIPGAAGVIGRRPFLGLVGATLAAIVASLLWHAPGSLPDPLAVGGLPAALVFVSVALFALVYLLMLGISLAAQGRN